MLPPAFGESENHMSLERKSMGDLQIYHFSEEQQAIIRLALG